MTTVLLKKAFFPTVMAGLIAGSGCNGARQDELPTAPAPAPKAARAETPGGGGRGGPGGRRQRSPIGEIMARVGSPRNSMTQAIGKELNEEAPAWETIQAQTKDYAVHAADLAKYDPPKGSKESWATLTGEFASHASELDKAAQAKDRAAALAAHGQLANSCMGCHQEHRIMGPGRGMGGNRPGGPPGGNPGEPPSPPPGG